MSTSNKAVIYTRISSIDQQRGSSLQTQREGCEEYAVRCGLEVVASFFDAQSGFDAEREGLYAALELLRQGDACNLIVYQLDRLNRDFVHSVLTRETVRGLGATLHIAARGSATSDDTIQQDNLEAVLAHREAQLVKERTTRGLRAKAEAGKIIGGGRPPFGYRRMGGGRDARWEIDDTTAATVRLIFQMYVYERLSAKEIALRLTAEGHLRAVDLDGSYANRGKQGRWQITSIHPILANPAYKGETIQNVGGKTYHQQVPAIIDPALWEAAKERRKRGLQKGWGRPSKYEYLLAGRIFCTCGYSRTGCNVGNQGKTYLYYRCSTRPIRLEGERCPDAHLPAKPVDELVWDWVINSLLDPQQAAAELDRRQQQSDERQAELVDRIMRIKEQEEVRHQQVSRLVDLFLDGTLPKDLLATKHSELQDELEEFQRARAELEQRAEAVVTASGVAAVSEFISELQHGSDLADFEERRRLLALLDVRVTAGRVRGPGPATLVVKIISVLSNTLLTIRKNHHGGEWQICTPVETSPNMPYTIC